MNSQFGEKLRTPREKQHLYLRQVAPLLEMDTAQLSKIEKGLRQPKREQIPIIAEILNASSDELMKLRLADQIYAVVKDEKLATEAMQIAEKNINQKTQEIKTMNTYPLKDISTTSDRFKVFTLMCIPNELADKIAFIKSQNINVINIGKELANYIDSLEDFRFLNIDAYDFAKKLLDKHRSKINGTGNDVVAIYNLGILMEPALELNAVQLFKEFSKSTSLIIIWDNQSENPDRLEWPTQKQNFFLDFSDIQLKKLQYAI